jgi:predicted DNA-binding protein with PD1-like motif
LKEAIMLPRALSTAARPRTLIHPGRFNPVRIQSMRATSARHFRLTLQPGRSLFEALVRPLAEQGVENASTTILGGSFAQLHYCVAPPDPSGQAVIAYASPIDAGRAYMIFGNATLGKSVENLPLVHCHAAIRTEVGEIKGGHILTETCIVGSDPISVLVTSLDGFELRQVFDPETNISLLQPCKQVTDDYHEHR